MIIIFKMLLFHDLWLVLANTITMDLTLAVCWGGTVEFRSKIMQIACLLQPSNHILRICVNMKKLKVKVLHKMFGQSWAKACRL